MIFSTQYLISQIFTILGYCLTTATYHVQKRKIVLALNLLSKFSFTIAYILLGAWSALAMIGVSLVRNTVFMIEKNENDKNNNTRKKDIFMLIIVYILTILSALFTYESFFSLLPAFATLIYTYSIFQKNIKVYRLLGIPTELCCIIYNFYIKSISAIILGSLPLVSSIIGYRNEVKKEKRVS